MLELVPAMISEGVLHASADSCCTCTNCLAVQWAGREGRDVYPGNMNPSISWPSGVEPGAVLYQQHDKDLLWNHTPEAVQSVLCGQSRGMSVAPPEQDEEDPGSVTKVRGLCGACSGVCHGRVSHGYRYSLNSVCAAMTSFPGSQLPLHFSQEYVAWPALQWPGHSCNSQASASAHAESGTPRCQTSPSGRNHSTTTWPCPGAVTQALMMRQQRCKPRWQHM